MKHFINPLIDYVFKILFGTEENLPLLLDFLNKTLAPEVPIETVKLLNTFSEREIKDDKLAIVDVKAEDESGAAYHVEIQLTSQAHLSNRMLYYWSRLYKQQIDKGAEYDELRPVVSIWLLTEPMIKDSDIYHHCFELWDEEQGVKLNDQLAIHVLELSKWIEPEVLQAQDYWPYFFREGRHFKSLPGKLNNQVMQKAMTVLREISEQEQEYHRYVSREEYLRNQRTMEKQRRKAQEDLIEAEKRLDKAEQDIAQAEQDIAQAEQDKAQTEQELQQLRDKLREAGIDPDKL